MNACEERSGQLAECLEELRNTLVELTAVFRVKRQVLARADMEALSELFEREQAVMEAFFQAESRREVLVEEIAAATGTESGRLVDLAEALPGSVAEVLVDAGARLKTTTEVLVREARVVATICQAAVEHYEKLVRIIAGAEVGGGLYTPGGKKAGGTRRSIIDQAI